MKTLTLRSTLDSVLLAFTAAAFLIGCGTSGAPSEADRDPAQMLAEIDNGSGLSESEVAPYRVALDELESICSQEGGEIADMTIAGRDFAEKRGVDPTALQVLQGSASMAKATMRNTGASGAGSCRMLISAWLTVDIARGK